jgi:hypothetical protein
MSVTDEQITAGAAQLRSMKGRARSGEYRDLAAHDSALEGLARALESRSAAGLRAWAERLDSAAAYVGESSDGVHRRIVARALQLSRMIESAA